MVVVSILHMNVGDGETSYASNSNLQKDIILKMRPVVQDSIKDMLSSINMPKCLKIADLGCSSGPNTFSVISYIIDTVQKLCQEMINCELPEFHFFLNDLPGNDFNTIFKSTPHFYEELKKVKGEKFGDRIFIAGVPGSFYGKLFPSRTLDFVHSSNSLHWLSQVPDGLEDNKGCIYISNTSPPQVLTAYKNQFQKDFSTFLRQRAEEIVCGGRMVLEFLGRNDTSEPILSNWQFIGDSLLDMAAEGLVKESDIESFNMPFHLPSMEEVQKIIREEGSFNVDKLKPHEISGDPLDDQEGDKSRSAQIVANTVRAVIEVMLASHFGDNIIDDLFLRFRKRIAEQLSMGESKVTVLMISLAKK